MTTDEILDLLKKVTSTLSEAGIKIELHVTIGDQSDIEEPEDGLVISDLGSQPAIHGETDMYLGFNGGPAGSVFWGDEDGLHEQK